MLHKYTVTYYLDDEQEKRVMELNQRCNSLMPEGLNQNTPESFFEFLMREGSVSEITQRLDFGDRYLTHQEQQRAAHV